MAFLSYPSAKGENNLCYPSMKGEHKVRGQVQGPGKARNRPRKRPRKGPEKAVRGGFGEAGAESPEKLRRGSSKGPEETGWKDPKGRQKRRLARERPQPERPAKLQEGMVGGLGEVPERPNQEVWRSSGELRTGFVDPCPERRGSGEGLEEPGKGSREEGSYACPVLFTWV